MGVSWWRVFVAVAAFLAAAAVLVVAGKDNGNGFCGMSQEQLYECKAAVATGSAVPPPSSTCCEALAMANVTCFCDFKNNIYLPLLGINATRAMQLPSICDPKKTATCN
ncbi:putative lipid-transfer protein DIR1 [Andrographis paniculata]|uniref:putative lipid-transfer protein DIR1 n=1 Tax=Andrographis paniculata TaxID=175694 RepID=UPI0021E9833C|nr:putative lipid-transfer protein DIR1 [Andrographis paniculata]